MTPEEPFNLFAGVQLHDDDCNCPDCLLLDLAFAFVTIAQFVRIVSDPNAAEAIRKMGREAAESIRLASEGAK